MTRTCSATLLLVLVLGLAACGDVAEIAAGGEPDSDVVRSAATEPAPTDAPTDRATHEAEPAPDPEPEPEQTEPPASEREALAIGDSGFTVIPSEFDDTTHYLSFAALVTNPNPDTHLATYVDVNISFKDEAGTVVKTAADTMMAVLPGQTVAVGDTLIDAPAGVVSMDVQVRADDWEEVDAAIEGFEARDVTYAPGELGSATTASIHSTFAQDIESPVVVAVYRSADGAIVGGDYTYADFIPAGSDIGVEVSSYQDVPGVATAEVYARLSSLSLVD